MKKMILSALALVIVCGGFWLLAPPHLKDKLIGVATFATAERQCFNYRKKSFNDPFAAYVDSSHIWTKESELRTRAKEPDPIFEEFDAVISVKVYVKNRVGAYSMDFIRCPLVDGRFDEDGTRGLMVDEYVRRRDG